MLSAFAAQESVTVGGDMWTFTDNLNAIAGGAQPGELFNFNGGIFLLLSTEGLGTGMQIFVPEPASGLLLGLGVVAVLRRRRKR